ncbi:hypothetical protein [Mycolicibacterium lacusdiani]|uniref:hypothetical protein n=1 Tax=Mycolicibacterium lacusdiani TaxID=2895283 RepID=UPI001F1D56AC|nr:hypothetical protein [Mycolicibacterium lacusdiani]
MSSSSLAECLSDLLPVLVLFGPTTVVLLVCRYLNRRDERQPVGNVDDKTVCADHQ